MDGIYLRRNWGGEFENVAILIAIAVNEDGYREVLAPLGVRRRLWEKYSQSQILAVYRPAFTAMRFRSKKKMATKMPKAIQT